jgi:hypothetical protein
MIESRKVRLAAEVTPVGKLLRKRPLGRLRRRCEDNIKIDLKDIWSEGVYWIQQAQDMVKRLAPMNIVMNLRIP